MPLTPPPSPNSRAHAPIHSDIGPFNEEQNDIRNSTAPSVAVAGHDPEASALALTLHKMRTYGSIEDDDGRNLGDLVERLSPQRPTANDSAGTSSFSDGNREDRCDWAPNNGAANSNFLADSLASTATGKI